MVARRVSRRGWRHLPQVHWVTDIKGLDHLAEFSNYYLTILLVCCLIACCLGFLILLKEDKAGVYEDSSTCPTYTHMYTHL